MSPEHKRMALGALVTREGYALALLRAVQSKQIAASDLNSDLARRLQYLGSADIDALLQSVWGSVRNSDAAKAEMIAQYKALVTDPSHPAADASLGRAIFSQTCQRCHTLYGTGEDIGPDLTGSNRSDLDYLLSNVVDPSAIMSNEYQPTIVITVDGRVVTGLIRAEDDRALTLQTAENLVVIPKSEIEERRVSPQSMMPDDQLKQFSEHELRSLITYVSGSKQVSMLATSDTAALLYNGQDLTGWSGEAGLFSVENGEIIAKSEQGISRNRFLVSDLTLEDFKLSLEIKLVDNAGNSGVQFRSELLPDGEMRGYQADVGADWWGKLYEEHGRELLWDRPGDEHVKLNDWNKYEIIAEGSKIRTYLNGNLCVDLDDPEGARRGVLALQLHSGGPTEIRFRNLKLEVPPAGDQLP
jgi:putative heme-binding domain-containing protein